MRSSPPHRAAGGVSSVRRAVYYGGVVSHDVGHPVSPGGGPCEALGLAPITRRPLAVPTSLSRPLARLATPTHGLPPSAPAAAPQEG